MSKKAVEASPNTVMAENVRNSFPQPKYTDPTPTSSASFKPPRSKDSILKLKNQPTQSEGWFSGFSYIKGYFTGSSTTDNSAKKISDDLKKAQTDKKSSITKNVANQKENQIEQSKKASNKQDELLASRGSLLPSTVLTDSKPASLDKSIADSDKATKSYLGVSSNKVKDNLEKTEQEQQHNAASPSYTPVRHVDNRSTYLHTPDKKGTTSYRVTTGATVNPKPVPCHTSPSPAPIKIVSQQSQKLMSPSRSKAPGRKMSPSPRKPNPESISISSSSRLRSKSTTDRSTIKARPVSLSTSQKSLHLERRSQNDACGSKSLVAKHIHAVANVKTSPNPSFLKPTILVDKPANLELTLDSTIQTLHRNESQVQQIAISKRKPLLASTTRLTSRRVTLRSPTKTKEPSGQRTKKSQTVKQQNSSSKTVGDNNHTLRPTLLQQERESAQQSPVERLHVQPVSPTFPRPSLILGTDLDQVDRLSPKHCRQLPVATELSQKEVGIDRLPKKTIAMPFPFRVPSKRAKTATVTTNVPPLTLNATDTQRTAQLENITSSLRSLPEQSSPTRGSAPSLVIESQRKKSPIRISLPHTSPTLCKGIPNSSSGFSDPVKNVKPLMVNQLEDNVNAKSAGAMASASSNNIKPIPQDYGPISLHSELKEELLNPRMDQNGFNSASRIEHSKQDTESIIINNDCMGDSLNLHKECDRSNSSSAYEDLCSASSPVTNSLFEVDELYDDNSLGIELCNTSFPMKKIPFRHPHEQSENRLNKIHDTSIGPTVLTEEKCDGVIHLNSFPSQTSLLADDIRIRFFADEKDSVDSARFQTIEKMSPKVSNCDRSKKDIRGTDDMSPVKPTSSSKNEEKETTTYANYTFQNRGLSPELTRATSGNRGNEKYRSPKSSHGSRFLEAISNVQSPTVYEVPTVQAPSYLKVPKKTKVYNSKRKTYEFLPKSKETSASKKPIVHEEKVDLFESPEIIKRAVASAFGSAVGKFTDMLKPVLSPGPESLENGPDNVTQKSPIPQSSPEKSYPKPTLSSDKPLSATRVFISNFLQETGIYPLLGVESERPENKTSKIGKTGRIAPTNSPAPPSVSPVILKSNDNKSPPSPKIIKQSSRVLGPTVLPSESNPRNKQKQLSTIDQKNSNKPEKIHKRVKEAVDKIEKLPGTVNAKKDKKVNVSNTPDELITNMDNKSTAKLNTSPKEPHTPLTSISSFLMDSTNNGEIP